MKLILALLLFPCLAHAQYRPLVISSVTPQAIMRNFNQVALRVNRSLDKYGNDTIYGSPTFKKDVVFSSTVTLPTREKLIFGNEIHNSTSTQMASYSTNQTTFASCIPGSTVTLTTSHTGRLLFMYTGSSAVNTGDRYTQLAVMIDGQLWDGAYGITYLSHANAGYQANQSTQFLTRLTVAAGTHTFCLAFRTNSAAATIGDVADTYSQFSVMELH